MNRPRKGEVGTHEVSSWSVGLGEPVAAIGTCIEVDGVLKAEKGVNHDH